MVTISKSQYDIFIAYYQLTGIDFAKYLKKGLGEQEFKAFLDVIDIPKLIKPETTKWREVRDKALENSNIFVLIMTKGFNTRKEVLHELLLATKLKKDSIFCKHEELVNSDLIVRIDLESINLSDRQYVEFNNQPDLLRKILNILSSQNKTLQIYSLEYVEHKPKLEITDFKMNVVNGDLRVNFELWNNGKVIVKLSSIEGIATDKKGNEISPRAREPGDLIAIGTRKPVSLNFKYYNEDYEEIIIIKKFNDQIKQEKFKIEVPFIQKEIEVSPISEVLFGGVKINELNIQATYLDFAEMVIGGNTYIQGKFPEEATSFIEKLKELETGQEVTYIDKSRKTFFAYIKSMDIKEKFVGTKKFYTFNITLQVHD